MEVLNPYNKIGANKGGFKHLQNNSHQYIDLEKPLQKVCGEKAPSN